MTSSAILFGLSVTGIGLLIVFAALILIIFILKGVSLPFTRRKPQQAQQQAVQMPTAVATQPEKKSPVKPKGADPKVAAAIAAAIACMDDAPPGSLVVRSVRRVTNAPAWNRAGR